MVNTVTPLGFCEICHDEKITQNDVPICVKCGDQRNVSGGVFDPKTKTASPVVVDSVPIKNERPTDYREEVVVPTKLSSMDACLDAILTIIDQMPMPKTAKQFTQINKFKQTILKLKEGN